MTKSKWDEFEHAKAVSREIWEGKSLHHGLVSSSVVQDGKGWAVKIGLIGDRPDHSCPERVDGVKILYEYNVLAGAEEVVAGLTSSWGLSLFLAKTVNNPIIIGRFLFSI